MEKRIDLEWEVLLQCEPFGNTEAYQANEMQNPKSGQFRFCDRLFVYSFLFSNV